MAPNRNSEFSDKIASAVERAHKFLVESRNSEGFWSDFLTLAGESTFWVSGYVGYAVLGYGEKHENGDWIDRVGSRLLSHQNGDGGWGYGYGVPSDADSTSWCLLFLSKLGLSCEESFEKALSFLLRHQSGVDGGFRTYAVPKDVGRYMGLDEGVSFEGWSSSQMCVTATAAQALIRIGSTRGVEEALGFIRTGQAADGYWNPYWWSGKLYATVNCMKALVAKKNDADFGQITHAQKWIAGAQLGDGSWSDSSGQTAGWAFSTALAVRGLLLLPDSLISDRTKGGVRWLLNRQLHDGSWASNHILRIPYSWMKDPWNQNTWNRDGRAINAAIKDHRRVFTTATALASLLESESRILEGKV